MYHNAVVRSVLSNVFHAMSRSICMLQFDQAVWLILAGKINTAQTTAANKRPLVISVHPPICNACPSPMKYSILLRISRGIERIMPAFFSASVSHSILIPIRLPYWWPKRVGLYRIIPTILDTTTPTTTNHQLVVARRLIMGLFIWKIKNKNYPWGCIQKSSRIWPSRSSKSLPYINPWSYDFNALPHAQIALA